MSRLNYSPMKIRVCKVCKAEFIGKLPHYPYKYCSDVCRDSINYKERLSAKIKPKGHRHPCNKCDKVFLAPNEFVRTCPECKSVQRHHPTGSDWWGELPV